ncbi:MAG: hypothetical protein PHN75_16960 [Syntrophales bacterium]|nr:hypothetical protein [Syntrophales bacterium]
MEIMVPEKPMTRKEFITALETLKAQQPVYVPEQPRSNPIGIYAFMLFGFLILAVALIWGLSSLKSDPTPFYPTPFIITLPAEKTLAPTVTKTSTVTPDITATRYYHPAMATIRSYFERLSMADYGSAWHMMTKRCQYSLCWDTFKSDYKFYIETMRRYGPMSIQDLRPETIKERSASAYVIIFYKWEMQPHSYRFFLLYDGEVWKLDTVEFISLVK